MAGATIPVDLFNPGQVFACLGFLEAADVLLGDAEGGFDWSEDADVQFQLRAAGPENPFAVILQFFAESTICCYAPIGYVRPPPKNGIQAGDGSDDSSVMDAVRLSESFPAPGGDRMALPIRLECHDRVGEIGHWADGSSRDQSRLYAGHRTGLSTASAMLRAVADK